MKILITGGAGFIGLHLASRLAQRGDQLIAIDNLNPQVHANPETSADRFPGLVARADVADPASWADLRGVDAVVHLAAETGTAQSMYEHDRYQRANVEGTRLAGAAAARANAVFVSMSSRAVYGEGLRRGEGVDITSPEADFGVRGDLKPSHEDDPHRPVSFYGTTKSQGEGKVTAEAVGRVPTTILRPQNVVGQGQALHNPYTGVLAAFLARLKEGRPIQVYGDGTQTRDFVHVSDLVDLIVWSIDNPPSLDDCRVLNCGTGIRTTLAEVATYAAAAAPTTSLPIEHVQVHRAGDIEHACADLGRLRALQAPLPQLTSEQAIGDFIRQSWHLRSPDSRIWAEALAELESHGLSDEE